MNNANHHLNPFQALAIPLGLWFFNFANSKTGATMNEIIETIGLLADNATGLGETAAIAAQTALDALKSALYWFVVAISFVFLLGRSVRAWWHEEPLLQAQVEADGWLMARQIF